MSVRRAFSEFREGPKIANVKEADIFALQFTAWFDLKIQTFCKN